MTCSSEERGHHLPRHFIRNKYTYNFEKISDGDRTSPRDELCPNVIVDHVWLGDDDVTTGVQITELKSPKSRESPESPTEVKHYQHHHAWSYAHSRFQQNEQRLANERRNEILRMANQSNDFDIIENEYDNDVFSSYYDSPDNDNHNDYKQAERDGVILNHQMNCFTIIDKHNKLNSENSSDEYQNMEEIHYNETMPDYSWDCNDKRFDTEEMPMYDQNLDAEKRTIWIYSFKNKRLLTDDDFQLVNIPSKDTSASSSTEDTDVRKDRTKSSRAATPIPSMFVPKLNIALTPTLPTVSEVTEPKKHSTSNQTEKSAREANIKRKTRNNWCSKENPFPLYENCTTTNVIDWMSLSPRKKRRRFKNINMQSQINLPSVRNVSANAQNKLRILKESRDDETKRTVGSQTEVVVEIETHSRRSFRTPTSFRTPRTLRIDSSIDRVVEEPEIDVCLPEDRGDYVNDKCIPKLKIRKPKRARNSAITDPIEKLDGTWIAEDSTTRNNGPPEVHGDCAGNTLLIRNMSLLRPAQWTEYLPITESVPSLHLSVNTDSDHAPHKWYRRVAKFFLCCK